MSTLKKLFKHTNFGQDVMIAFILIIALGLLSNFLASNQHAKTVSSSDQSQVAAVKDVASYMRQMSVADAEQAMAEKGPVFTVDITPEALGSRVKVTCKATLAKIEVVDPNQVPDNEALGSYVNSTGGIGKSILEHGGKAYKLTFIYTNESDRPADYDSKWNLQSDELERILSSSDNGRFLYTYGQVPTWIKISNDPMFYESHVLKPGNKVIETVWLYPCPPVKRCYVGDFELENPVEIELP